MPVDLEDEIIYGNVKGVKKLVEQGAEINVIDKYALSPLIEAAMYNKLDIVELLLKNGATIDSPDLTGNTALHWAVDFRRTEVVRYLLDHNANPNAYNHACQPVLVFPLLRGHEDLKDLLFQYGADLNFAQDYINTKLIGHRYELEGQVYIPDTDNRFILVDYEGFFLEFTLNIIKDSLERYKKNYAARHWQEYFSCIRKMIDALENGAELIKFLMLAEKNKEYESRIERILSQGLLLIPIAYEGHAITCIKCGDYWIKIDRGYNANIEGSVVIYKISKPKHLTKSFLKDLIYKAHSREYVNERLNDYIGLKKIGEMPLPLQVIGNCSWANVEGSIAAMFLLLLLHGDENLTPEKLHEHVKTATEFFDDWREWDKDRALEETIQSFHHASKPRKAAKAGLLAAVLVQKCRYDVPRELERAEKILPILSIPDYQYNLKSYIKVFLQDNKTEVGDNIMHLLDLAAPKGSNLLSEVSDSLKG